ncbi:RNF213 [Mytilus edulis]|uniref:RNF213 n=1 Tax=Mytilus edulis TaxID=6550 RepID=A0A8S3U7N2_MYTED|nr:RNF213 [Mytilus edulis]
MGLPGTLEISGFTKLPVLGFFRISQDFLGYPERQDFSGQHFAGELDTCHELEWLKIVDKSQGSVEVNSLHKLKLSTSMGHIILDFTKQEMEIKEKDRISWYIIIFEQISDVLELRVTEKKEGKILRREYNYEQLHDLQSRLMLVAGKAELGKDDVDRFILVINKKTVEDILAKGLICAISEGKQSEYFMPYSTTFPYWKFFESLHHIACVLGKEIPNAPSEAKQMQLTKMSVFSYQNCQVLEQCHERWLEFIDKKRDDYYVLNYFSIEQMVILQQELVKMGVECEPSNLIYPLLSIIKHDCTKENLVKAMKEAKEELEKMDVDEADDEEKEIPMEDADSEAVIGRFILNMMEAGNSEALAREALKNVTPDQINEGTL